MNVLFPDPYYWEAVVYCCLLWGLAILPLQIFVNRATLFCGRISYSIYLLHPLTVFLLNPVYQRFYARGWPVGISFLACSALTLSLLLPMAWASYRLIELPGMKMGKTVLAWRRRVGRTHVAQIAG